MFRLIDEAEIQVRRLNGWLWPPSWSWNLRIFLTGLLLGTAWAASSLMIMILAGK